MRELHEGKFEGISFRSTEIDAQKRTLVFVHGLSGSLSAWYAYEELLTSEYNMVSLDIRGHGESFQPSSFAQYDPSASAEDVARLLAHLNVRDAILISHSYGTIVAIEFLAKDLPCLGAIFINPVFGLTQRRFFKVARFVITSLAALAMHVRGAKRGTRTDYTKFTPASDLDLRRIGADIHHMSVRSYVLTFAKIFNTNRDSLWERIRVPSLIIHGNSDSIVPLSSAEALCRVMKQGELHVISGNHILPLNNTREVASEIKRFVSRL
ncbi:MAG: hypothetical protein RIQ56_646 [Candidatus Parcubacteria bacterium]|jgi:pimeloyl-ACP methyl ester carboxylesterase